MSLSSVLKPAWRSLRRSPAYTLTATMTLVIGIGAAVAIFALVNGVLLRPLPYGEPERLVTVYHDLSAVGLAKGNQTAATYFTYKKLARSLDAIGIYQRDAENVSDPRGGGEPQRINSARITESVIPLLRVTPLVGRTFTEAEDRPNGPSVMLISEGLWRSRFGADRGVLGRTLEVNGRSREIIGVMPERFRFPSAETQLWMPMQLDPNDPFPGGFNYDGIGRLRNGVTVADAGRDLKAVLPRVVELSPNLAPGVPTKLLLDQGKPVPFVVPLKDDVTGGIAKTLWIVAAAAGVVLLVACANVTNLILVRADGRQRELAVREALGAGRARVMAYFLAESMVVTAVSGALGLALATLAIRVLVRTGPAAVPRLAEVHVDLRVVAFAVVVSVLVAVLCSIVPAVRVGRVQLSNALREGGRGGTAGRARQRVRSVLVAGQIALALVALASSGLLLRTFQQLNAVRPGFDTKSASRRSGCRCRGCAIRAIPPCRGSTRQLLDRVRALPGVTEAGISQRLPLVGNGMSQDPFYPEGDDTYASKIPPLQLYTTTDGGYFRAMGIPLLAGKTFDRLDVQRPNEAIISQATAVQFSGIRPAEAARQALPRAAGRAVVDRSLVSWRHAGHVARVATIAGRVFRVTCSRPRNSVQQARWTMALVVRTAGEPTASRPPVQRVVRELDPSLPLFDVSTMTDVATASMAQLSFTISCLGPRRS